MGQKTKEQVDSRKFKEEIRMENEHLINLSQHWYMNSIHHLLWFPRRISRHPFIVWLVLLFGWPLYGDFSTHGLIVSSKCVPCGSSFKSHEHPFFNFPFFSYIWGELSTKTLMAWLTFPWFSLLQWTTSHFHHKDDFKHIFARLVLSTIIYFL